MLVSFAALARLGVVRRLAYWVVRLVLGLAARGHSAAGLGSPFRRGCRPLALVLVGTKLLLGAANG